MAEPCGEPEPPITRSFESKLFGGGPITALVRRDQVCMLRKQNMASNNAPLSKSKVLEELGLEGLRVVTSETDISHMESTAGCAVVFSEALRRALQAFLYDRRGSSQAAHDSPCQMIFDVPEAHGLPPNPDTEQVPQVLRSNLKDDADAEIVLLTQATIEEDLYRFTPEYGESLVANWVFRIRLPNTFDVLTWAIVDRAGKHYPYAYCIG